MKLFSGFEDYFQGYLRLQLRRWRLCQLLDTSTWIRCMDSSLTAPVVRAEQAALEGLL